MSRDEVSRLVGDAMSDPNMITEAMNIKDQAAMESYISSKGYELTRDEVLEVWSVTAKVMAGHTQPMAEAEARIAQAKGA